MALSADGNTALIGGSGDNAAYRQGAAWVFTRSGGKWTQQGEKLVGPHQQLRQRGHGRERNGEFGWSVALSADGNTALIGGPATTLGRCRVGVHALGSTWSQQGEKLCTGVRRARARSDGMFGTSVRSPPTATRR